MESSGAGTILEPLLALEREDLTGVVEFTALGVTTRIYARGGEVCYAEDGTLGETLGRVLIRCGRLLEEHVAAIIRRMTDAVVDDRFVRFGEVLVEYGFLTADELDIALTQQVKEKVMGCVHRGAGHWSFKKDDPRVSSVGSYVVRTRPMLVEAAGQLPERRVESVLRLDENRYPEIVAPETVLVEEFELLKNEAVILKDLDGTSSIHFIFSTYSHATLAIATPLLAALVLGRGLELRTTPTGKRQPSEDRPIPPEFRTARRASMRDDQTMPHMASFPRNGPPVEGRGPSASTHSSPTLAVAPIAPQRRAARVRLGDPADRAGERAQKAFERLKVDLEARKPVSKRKRWPDPRNDRERRLMAESAFHHGRLHLRADEAERALPGLHRAAELRPQEREYELYVKWAQMLVNDTFKENARRAEVEALAAGLARETRDCELGLSILGHCTMHDGKDEAALRFFHRAAALDPKLVDAGRLARLLTTRAASQRKRPAPSKVDVSIRKGERGQLDTSLDELVPMPVPASAGHEGSIENDDGPTRRVSGQTRVMNRPAQGPQSVGGKSTPAGGLRAEPMTGGAGSWDGLPPQTPEPPAATVRHPEVGSSAAPAQPMSLPSSSMPPASPDLRPPVPEQALSPWRLPAADGGPMGVSTQPLTPRSLPSAIADATRVPGAIPEARAGASAAVILDDLPTGRPRHGRVVALVFAWSASLAATAAAAYFIGTREIGVASPTSSTTSSSGATSAIAVMETPPPSAIVSATPRPPETASAAPATPSTTPVQPVQSATKPAASSSGKPSTTGILHTPKAFGRRIFVDGRIVGEGGRDLTIACGIHRVKVGSAGTERSLTIPCGGSIELD